MLFTEIAPEEGWAGVQRNSKIGPGFGRNKMHVACRPPNGDCEWLVEYIVVKFRAEVLDETDIPKSSAFRWFLQLGVPMTVSERGHEERQELRHSLEELHQVS